MKNHFGKEKTGLKLEVTSFVRSCSLLLILLVMTAIHRRSKEGLSLFIKPFAMFELFYLVLATGYTQTANNTFGNNKNEGAYGIVYYSSGYFVTGFNFSTTNGDSDFFVLKLDSSMNIVSRIAGGCIGSTNDFAYAIDIGSDNGPVVAAAVYENCDISNGPGIGVYKYSSSLSQQWTVDYYDDDGCIPCAIRTMSDGSYIVTGTACGETQFIAKTSSSGAVVWDNQFCCGDESWEYFSGIREMSNHDIIVGVYIDTSDSFFFTFDSDGNSISQDDGSYDFSLTNVTDLQMLANGSLLVIGNAQSLCGTTYSGVIMKYDTSTCEIVTYICLNIGGKSTGLTTITQLQSSRIVIVGFLYPTTSSTEILYIEGYFTTGSDFSYGVIAGSYDNRAYSVVGVPGTDNFALAGHACRACNFFFRILSEYICGLIYKFGKLHFMSIFQFNVKSM
jgi:hypothetical protein